MGCEAIKPFDDRFSYRYSFVEDVYIAFETLSGKEIGRSFQEDELLPIFLRARSGPELKQTQ